MSSLQGYRELYENFKFWPGDTGITGRRVFLYVTNDVEHSADVPVIGDEFFPSGSTDPHATFGSQIRCRSIRKTFKSEDKRKWELVCDYSSEPYDPASFYNVTTSSPDTNSLTYRPINLEFGGDYMTLNPTENNPTGWTFPDGSSVQEG